MGYRVSSVLAVAHNDPHAAFLYFVPSRLLRYDWVNSWVDEHFVTLAGRLGPSAVIVAPAGEREDDYWHSFEPITKSLLLARGGADFLHSGLPFVIVATKPLVSASPNAAAINLAAIQDERQLAHLFDVLVEQIGKEGNLVAALPALTKDVSEEFDNEFSDSAWALERAVSLRPNVFGIGVDLNGAIEVLRDWLAARRRRESLLDPHTEKPEPPSDQ